MIKGIIIKPNTQPEVIEFPEGYENLCELVGGYIEMPYFYDDVDVVVNEEGKLLGLEPTLPVYYNGDLIDMLCGNVVLVDHNEEGETISLSEMKIKKYLNELSDGVIEIWR